MAEVRVLMVEARNDACVTKGNSYHPWRCPVRYVLEDGTAINTYETFRLKRDAVAELNSLPKPPRWDTFVDIEDGRFTGIVTMKIGIGAR